MKADRLDTAFEKLLGPLLAEAMAGSYGTDEDPLLAPWIRRIGSEVAAFAPRDDLKPKFTLLASDVTNALALPGGQVFVTRGLLESVTSDDELAGVLAHEVAHVAKRHALKHIGENGAAIALLSLVGRRDLRLLGTVMNVLRGLARSRGLESQADDVGLGLAAAAGYDPRGLVRFLESINGGKPSKLEAYFLTHPLPEKRIEACQKSPLVARFTLEEREAQAVSFERRGLYTSAAAVRAGQNPLILPVATGPTLTPLLLRDRESMVQQASASLKQLGGAWQAQRFGGTLQQLLLLNSDPGDLRWMIMAARAYGVYSRLLDAYARTVRTLQTSPNTWEALARRSDTARDAAAAALGRAGQVHEPLARAARAVLGVLADLNLRLWRLNSREQWIRFGALEGLLRYAESELSRVDERSGQAWRLLTRARLRLYTLRVNELTPAGDRGRQDLLQARVRARLGQALPDFSNTNDSGLAVLRLALAVQLEKRPAEINALRGEAAWGETLEKHGLPENIAIVLRQLVFDLEREK